MMEVHRYKSFKPAFSLDFARADLEIYGIDHFRPSYSGLVFFNAGDADPKEMRSDDPRCAGLFSVFGHSECVGDEGHCHPRVPGRFDMRRSDPLTKAFKRVTVTEALKAALADRSSLQITVLVSDGTDDPESAPRTPLFSCQGLQIVTFV